MGRDAMLLQSSLRDSIMFHDVPRTASWAKFSRPFGTNFVDLGSHAGALVLVKMPRAPQSTSTTTLRFGRIRSKRARTRDRSCALIGVSGMEWGAPPGLNRLRKKSLLGQSRPLRGFYETAVEFKGISLFFYS